MANVPAGPALPWASNACKPSADTSKQHHHDVEPSDVELGVSIDQLGLSIGDRIEVKWQICPDEGEPFHRWWGASIMATEQQAASTSGTSGPPAYKLRYDKAPDDGFEEEEVAEVQLLSANRLLDVPRQDIMAWRREGSDYEPPEEEEDEEEEEAEGIDEDEELADAEGGVVSLQQLASGITDAEVAAGEADMLDMLGAVDPAQQQHMAAGYRDFLENFKAFVSAKASAAEGGDVLITTADVEDFKAMLATQRSQRGGRM